MNLNSRTGSTVKVLCLSLISAALAGCSRDDAKVIIVPKQTAVPAMPALPEGHPDTTGMQMGSGIGMGMADRPKLAYQVPDGWTEADPGPVRVASFRIKQGDQEADVSVIPLDGAAGGDLANVNRWRGQVGLEPVSEVELKRSAEIVQIAGSSAELYDLLGKTSNGSGLRVLGAIQHRDGIAWFFKMTGEAELVGSQKDAFIGFMKSVKFEATDASRFAAMHGMSMPMNSAAEVSPAEGRPTWQVPADWQETSGGQFLVAKFLLTGEGATQAAVNVSASGGDGGGFVNNVNRWRGQLGLAPLSESEINNQSRSIEVFGGKATLIELNGTDPRSGEATHVIGAMVPRGSQTFFYKLAGEAALVNAQRSAFETFVKTAQY